MPKLGCGATGWGKALNRVAVALCSLPNGLKSRGLASPGESLQAVYAVAGSQHLLNGPALCWIEEFAGVCVSRCLLLRHNRLDGILPALHVAYRRQFRGDGLSGGELPPGFMLLALNDLELAATVPLLEVPVCLSVGDVAHAAPQGVAHDVTFVGNGLALEATILGKGDSFLRPLGRVGHAVLRQCCFSLFRLCNHSLGLVSKLDRNLTVCGKNLGRRMNLFPVACIVGGDLRGLRPTESAARDGFLNLLAARAGRLKILDGVAFHIGSAALPCLDLVAEIAKPERQLRLVDGGCKLLAIEVALRLNRACRAVCPLRHIEDHGVSMELGRGVAVHRAGGVMFKLRGDELAGGLGGVVAAETRLGVPLQLRKGDGHGLPVGLADTVIASDQSGQRYGFRS